MNEESRENRESREDISLEQLEEERRDALHGLEDLDDSEWDDYRDQEEAKSLEYIAPPCPLTEPRSQSPASYSPSPSARSFETSLAKARQADSDKLHRARLVERRKESIKGVFIGDELGFACHSQSALLLFNDVQMHKPRNAVKALVMLRDLGFCKLCTEEDQSCGTEEVVQFVPSSMGGLFEENNAFQLCRNCFKCWPKYSTNRFIKYPKVKDNWDAITVYVLRRRLQGYKGAKPPKVETMDLYNAALARQGKVILDHKIATRPDMRKKIAGYVTSYMRGVSSPRPAPALIQSEAPVSELFNDEPAYEHMRHLLEKAKSKRRTSEPPELSD